MVVLWDGHAVAKDGEPYDNRYCWVMSVVDGRVKEATDVDLCSPLMGGRLLIPARHSGVDEGVPVIVQRVVELV